MSKRQTWKPPTCERCPNVIVFTYPCAFPPWLRRLPPSAIDVVVQTPVLRLEDASQRAAGSTLSFVYRLRDSRGRYNVDASGLEVELSVVPEAGGSAVVLAGQCPTPADTLGPAGLAACTVQVGGVACILTRPPTASTVWHHVCQCHVCMTCLVGRYPVPP